MSTTSKARYPRTTPEAVRLREAGKAYFSNLDKEPNDNRDSRSLALWVAFARAADVYSVKIRRMHADVVLNEMSGRNFRRRFPLHPDSGGSSVR